jgi:hypothetical protein
MGTRAVFPVKTGRRIIAATRKVETERPRGADRRARYPVDGGTTKRLHGYTLGALAAADPPSPATVEVAIWVPGDSGDLEYAGRSVTATSYDSSLELVAGAYVRVERLAGQWQIYWAGCGEQLSTLQMEDGDQLLDESGQPLIEG